MQKLSQSAGKSVVGRYQIELEKAKQRMGEARKEEKRAV